MAGQRCGRIRVPGSIAALMRVKMKTAIPGGLWLASIRSTTMSATGSRLPRTRRRCIAQPLDHGLPIGLSTRVRHSDRDALHRPVEADVVHAFSRFFRDHLELAFYVRTLAKNGLRPVSITPEMVGRLSRAARERMRGDGGGYRRDHLRAFTAQRGRQRRSPHHGIEKRPAPDAGCSGRREIGGHRRARSRTQMAETEGFEPSVRFPVRRFSKALVSATHPRLRAAASGGYSEGLSGDQRG